MPTRGSRSACFPSSTVGFLLATCGSLLCIFLMYNPGRNDASGEILIFLKHNPKATNKECFGHFRGQFLWKIGEFYIFYCTETGK